MSDRLKIHFPESPGPQGEQHRSYKTFDDSPPIIAMPVGGMDCPQRALLYLILVVKLQAGNLSGREVIA